MTMRLRWISAALTLMPATGLAAPAFDAEAVRDRLLAGDSVERRAAIEEIAAAGEGVAAADLLVPAWAAAAGDPDAEVRQAVAWYLGVYVIGGRDETAPEAREAALRLARDEDPVTRRSGLGICLANIASPDEEVIVAMLEGVMGDPDMNTLESVVNALSRSRPVRVRAQATLLRWMEARGEEPVRAMRAFELYHHLMGREGPEAEAFRAVEDSLAPEQRRLSAVVFGPAGEAESAEALWATFAESLSPEIRPRVRRWNRPTGEVICAAVVEGFFACQAVIAQIETSPALRIQGFMTLTPDVLEAAGEEIEEAPE